MMDIDKLKTVFNDITSILTNNDATLEDVTRIGYSLIFSAWNNDPDKEALIDVYISWFSNSFRKNTENLLKEEKEKKE